MTPDYQIKTRQQQPYLGLWQRMVKHIADMSPDVPVYKRDLDRWLLKALEAQPDAREAVGVNTTLYGRE